MTASGKYPSWAYPANDWYSTLFKKRNINHHVGVNIRGGSKIMQYYVSLNYNHDSGMLKTDKLNQFDVNINTNQLYVLSNEKFMQPLQKIIPFLKLRYSWGKVGNDGIIDEPRFVYLEQVSQVGMSDPRPGGMNSTKGYHIKFYANPDIKWEINEQNNFGIETKLFNGLFDIQMDFYKQTRHNILDYRRVVPANVGLDYYQLANVGEASAHGFDFSGKIQKAFTPDFWIILNTTFTYSRAKYKALEEAADKPEWQRQVGHDISQQIGYIAEELFHDQAKIDNAPVQSGNVRPGDIRYRDINGDGKIDLNDAVHIGYPTTPRVIYGFNGNINYKQFEFLFAFQGSGQRSFFIDPSAISPFYGQRAMLKAIADDHWGAKTLRIYVRANNPFLISNFKLWDVELGSNGFNYPIQRTYSAGFNFSF